MSLGPCADLHTKFGAAGQGQGAKAMPWILHLSRGAFRDKVRGPRGGSRRHATAMAEGLGRRDRVAKAWAKRIAIGPAGRKNGPGGPTRPRAWEVRDDEETGLDRGYRGGRRWRLPHRLGRHPGRDCRPARRPIDFPPERPGRGTGLACDDRLTPRSAKPFHSWPPAGNMEKCTHSGFKMPDERGPHHGLRVSRHLILES